METPTGPAPPLSERLPQPCTGEEIFVEGTIRRVDTHLTNGRYEAFSTDENSANLKAVGDDGTRYVVNPGSQDRARFSPPGRRRAVDRFEMAGAEPGGDGVTFELHPIERLELRPEGTFTVTLRHFSSTCTG